MLTPTCVHAESNGWMPYTITTEPTFMRIILHGAITPQDFHALGNDITAIERDSIVAPNRLIDLGAVIAPYLTYPDMHAFAQRRGTDTIANPVKVAIVAPRPIHIGFARMYQNLNTHPQIGIEIFATAKAAEDWLRDA